MEHSLTRSKSSDSQFGLSKQEQLAIQSTQSIQIRELSDQDVKMLADKIWLLVKTKLDLNPKSLNDEKAKVMVLMEDIRDYPNLTKDDIMIALKNGLNGKYLGKESFVHFNSSNFNIWLSKYSIEKTEIMRSMNYKEEKEIDEILPSAKEQFQMTIDITNTYADAVDFNRSTDKPFNWILGGLNYVYDDLVSHGVLSLNTEQKKGIIEDVKKKHPTAQGERLTDLCKKHAFIWFVNQLANNNQRVNNKGQIQHISTH